MKIEKVKQSDIAFDTGTQCRIRQVNEVVEQYARRMAEGDKFPPVVLFKDDNGKYYIGDGWHRLAAMSQLSMLDCMAEVHSGGRAGAVWYALGANEQHGVRITNEDKRRKIKIALREFPDRSNRQIAEQVGVSDKTVGAARGSGAEIPHLVVGKDGKKYTRKAKPVITEADADPVEDGLEDDQADDDQTEDGDDSEGAEPDKPGVDADSDLESETVPVWESAAREAVMMLMRLDKLNGDREKAFQLVEQWYKKNR